MMHVGEQVDKSLSISIENPNVLNIPNVLMISSDVLMASPRCTEHPPDVLNTPNVLMISPNVLNTSRRTQDIPPMYTATWQCQVIRL